MQGIDWKNLKSFEYNLDQWKTSLCHSIWGNHLEWQHSEGWDQSKKFMINRFTNGKRHLPTVLVLQELYIYQSLPRYVGSPSNTLPEFVIYLGQECWVATLILPFSLRKIFWGLTSPILEKAGTISNLAFVKAYNKYQRSYS